MLRNKNRAAARSGLTVHHARISQGRSFQSRQIAGGNEPGDPLNLVRRGDESAHIHWMHSAVEVCKLLAVLQRQERTAHVQQEGHQQVNDKLGRVYKHVIHDLEPDFRIHYLRGACQ